MSRRINPDADLRKLERDYQQQPSLDKLRRLNVLRARHNVRPEFDDWYLITMRNQLVSLMSEQIEEVVETSSVPAFHSFEKVPTIIGYYSGFKLSVILNLAPVTLLRVHIEQEPAATFVALWLGVSPIMLAHLSSTPTRGPALKVDSTVDWLYDPTLMLNHIVNQYKLLINKGALRNNPRQKTLQHRQPKYRRNADTDFRSLERRALNGDIQDKIAFAQALLRKGRTSQEQEALDAAQQGDYTLAEQLTQSSQNPKVYVVTIGDEQVDSATTVRVIGLPDEYLQTNFTQLYLDPPEYFAGEAPLTGTTKKVHGALYDMFQHCGLASMKYQTFPTNFIKFVTPDVDYTTASFHVIPFNNIVKFLEQEYAQDLERNTRKATHLIEYYFQNDIRTIPVFDVAPRLKGILAEIDAETAHLDWGIGDARQQLMQQRVYPIPDLTELYHFAVQIGFGIDKAVELADLLGTTPSAQLMTEVTTFLRNLDASNN